MTWGARTRFGYSTPKNYDNDLYWWNTPPASKVRTWVVPGVGNSDYYRTRTALSGKVYCEFRNQTRPGNLDVMFGFSLATPGVFYNANAWGIVTGQVGCGLTAAQIPGFTASGSMSSSAAANFGSNIVGIAYDATTRQAWYSVNGVWVQGNPATGTSPTHTLPVNTWYFAYSAYSCGISSGSYTFEVFPDAASQTYGPPAGFTPYNPA